MDMQWIKREDRQSLTSKDCHLRRVVTRNIHLLMVISNMDTSHILQGTSNMGTSNNNNMRLNTQVARGRTRQLHWA